MLFIGPEHMNADMSAEMLLADVLNRTGSFALSKNWYYSTELRVLNTQLFYKLGLLLSSNWCVARTIATALMLLVFLGCYFYFARQAGLPRGAVWVAVAMLCPFSTEYVWVVQHGAFYLPCLSLLFATLGLVFHIKRLGAAAGKKAPRHALPLLCPGSMLLLLAFVAGLGGIRQLLVCYLPLMVCCLYLAVHYIFTHKKLCATPLQPSQRGTLYFALASVFATLACGAGYLVNSKILARVYTVSDFSTQRVAPFDPNTWLKIYGGMVALFGYRNDVQVFSILGVQSICSILWLLLLSGALLVGLKMRRQLPQNDFLILVVCLASFLVNVPINALTGMTAPRYLLPAALLALVVLFLVIYRYPYKNKLAGYLPGLVCLLLLGVTWARPQLVSERTSTLKAAVDWLLANDYTQGYATYWNSDIAVERSN
ncbi:MAG: hypothetical protein PHO10_11435, partial [Gemmiger sp.]|nr:hypothetical protein [Gemmiger sp.]